MMNPMSSERKKDIIFKINDEIKNCRKCELWKNRKNAVPGEGNANAVIMFIGEAPGRVEDEQGRPFVGRAGKLLTELIEDVLEIKRSEVYITNVVKCRPPGNRDPNEKEISTCTRNFLERQIDVINPKIIVGLGNHACSYLLKKYGQKINTVSKVHGKIFEVQTLFGKKHLFITYHPAAALYNPNIKDVLREDFSKLKELYKKIRD